MVLSSVSICLAVNPQSSIISALDACSINLSGIPNNLDLDSDGDAMKEGGIINPHEIEELEKLFGLS